MGKFRVGCFLCLGSLFLSFAGGVHAAIPGSERAALIILYNSTDGANWVDRTNWRNSGDTDFNDAGTECTWHGVHCNGAGDSVIDLWLDENNLSGSIPTCFSDLPNLQELSLDGNQLSGTIPTELGNLSALQKLALHSNQLTGNIPTELGSLSNLEELSLCSNELDGHIPSELGNLSNLQFLYLYSNQLTGNIPTELGNLSNLEVLRINSNQLDGHIPTELGNLSNLGALYLYSNQLGGNIPTELGNLSNLQFLYLQSNQLNGTIPTELGNLSNLLLLNLRANRLSGNIPTELGDLLNLQYLYLYSNQLDGNIPTEIGNLVNLKYLNLRANRLDGYIPSELGDLTALTDNGGLDLRWNALHSDNAVLIAFCNSKQSGGDWHSTQTLAPGSVGASLPTSSSVVLDWNSIAYTANDGYYAVFVDPAPPGASIYSDDFESGGTAWWGLGNPWKQTVDKTDTSVLVDGLESATTYDFVIRTVSESHTDNSNQVISEAGTTVTETTTSP